MPEPLIHRLDLRGVRCPLNWAKARVRLDDIPREAVLELVIDDPKAVRDIPGAAEAHGYVVTEVAAIEEGLWRISILK